MSQSTENGNGNGAAPLILGKTSAVQISLYSLLFVLAQAVIMTATIMTMRQSDQAEVAAIRSDLNWVRANQAAYGSLPEKIEVSARAVELLRQRIDYLNAEMSSQNGRQLEFSRAIAKIGEDTLKNTMLIQNVLDFLSPLALPRKPPKT